MFGSGRSRRPRRLSHEQIRVIARLLAVYLLALLVPIVTGTILYFVQIREVEQEIFASRERSLALNKRIVESAILSIEGAITEIRQDEAIARMSNLPPPLENRLALRTANLYQDSRLALAMPEYVLEVVVYLKQPDLVLTTNDVFFDTELFYRAFLSIPGTTYEEWRDELRQSEYVHSSLEFKTIVLGGEERETIRLTSSLPFTTRFVGSGSVTVYVHIAAVEELLATYLAGSDGFARIELPDGRELASVGVEGGRIEVPNTPTAPQSGVQFVDVADREYAVSYIRSEVNRWLYVSGTPIEVFFAQSSRIRFLFAGILLLLVAVGVPILLIQVFGLSRPIAETSRILRDGVVRSERRGSDPFSFISHSVDELIRRDRTLRDLIEEQQPLVRGVVLERLFRGDYPTHEIAKAHLVHFGIGVPRDATAVYCILIEGYFDVPTPEIIGEFTVKSALIRDELERLLPETALMHTISHGTICVALFIDDSGAVPETGGDAATLIQIVSRQSRAMREVRCTVAAGGVANGLSDISACIRRAIEAAERSTPGSIAAAIPGDDREHEGYVYPTDVELELIKAVRGGRPQEVSRIGLQIRRTNFTERSLSRESVRRLYRELEATRVKIVQRLPTDQHVRFDPETTGIAERIDLLLAHLEQLARELGDEGAANHAMKASIEQFVQSNVFNPEMGLKLLALEFNLSEVYLSRVFPQLFGENFHSYVERARMEQAATLLQSTRLTIDEIADRVGYQSANTFRRVFKRTYGISPSGYNRTMA